jgi:hypothetical protein
MPESPEDAFSTRLDEYIQRLKIPLSLERLASYSVIGDAAIDPVVRYFWNVALCEALYPTLNAVEIALRNAIHTSMTSYYGTENWFDNPDSLESDQYAVVQVIKSELRSRGKSDNAGRVIAQIHFGFWVTMLSKPYEQRVWERNGFAPLRATFPHATRRERKRWLLYRRFADTNALRNRVFHYEPIWDEVVIAGTRHDVHDLHRSALEAIGWMSPELRDSLTLLDRFEVIYASGFAQLSDDIQNYFQI